MNSSIKRKVKGLLYEAKGLGYAPEAVALGEEAVRLADSHDDAALAYEARMSLMDILAFSGDGDKLLVAFSWCLAYADKRPAGSQEDGFFEWELLWKYKWVIDNLAHFPRISRAQIDEALDDFETRCQKAGFDKRSALSRRFSIEVDFGNLAEAKRLHAEYALMDRDGMNDCQACELNRAVVMHALLDEHEKAIKAAAPILKGSFRCAEIPHLTYGVLLRSFWHARGLEETAKIHEKGYRLVRSNREFLPEQARHIMHLLRANQLDGALMLVRRHLAWALETRALDRQYFFLLATRATARRFSENGSKSLRVKLSKELCPAAGKVTIATKPFLKWLDENINRLAGEFDARNGNNWYGHMAKQAEPIF